jgi:hypothetical protein
MVARTWFPGGIVCVVTDHDRPGPVADELFDRLGADREGRRLDVTEHDLGPGGCDRPVRGHVGEREGDHFGARAGPASTQVQLRAAVQLGGHEPAVV